MATSFDRKQQLALELLENGGKSFIKKMKVFYFLFFFFWKVSLLKQILLFERKLTWNGRSPQAKKHQTSSHPQANPQYASKQRRLGTELKSSRQALQVTSHPNSPGTTGNEPGGVVRELWPPCLPFKFNWLGFADMQASYFLDSTLYYHIWSLPVEIYELPSRYSYFIISLR